MSVSLLASGVIARRTATKHTAAGQCRLSAVAMLLMLELGACATVPPPEASPQLARAEDTSAATPPAEHVPLLTFEVRPNPAAAQMGPIGHAVRAIRGGILVSGGLPSLSSPSAWTARAERSSQEITLYVTPSFVSEGIVSGPAWYDAAMALEPGRYAVRVQLLLQGEPHPGIPLTYPPVVISDVAAPAIDVTFDPGAVRPGSSLLGLSVDGINAQRAIDSSWVGGVRFRDTLRVRGSVMAHPESDYKAPCFEVDSASARQLPRWPGDERRHWFCFENDSLATMLLGPPEYQRDVTITIDRFTINRNLTDAVNSARIITVDPVSAPDPDLPPPPSPAPDDSGGSRPPGQTAAVRVALRLGLDPTRREIT